MIRVWQSNRLEQLASRLIDNLHASGGSPASRIFAGPPIVVPNRNIETYLKYEIARGSGVAAALAFYVPESFLAEIFCRNQDGSGGATLLHAAALRAFFLEVLSGPSATGEPDLLPGPVRAYLEAASDDPDARDRRRLQLAARLARLAHHYGEARPELLRAWSVGRAEFATAPDDAATEAWQRALWEQLLAARRRAQDARKTAWVLPWESLDQIDATVLKRPGGVHFFGFSYFTPAQFELIGQLDRHTTLQIYSFTPCRWHEDDVQRGAARKRPRRMLSGPAESEAAEPSIVASWGTPGRDCADRLRQFAGASFDSQFAASHAPTVLARLQREILERAPENGAPFEPDDSLVILGCPGIRREAEIVANEIWRLVQEDDRTERGQSQERLRFRDIAVLFADSANRASYQAHFRAVLEELHGIPFNMVDLPLASECQVIEAVLLLLALPLGEFTRPELLKILGHPALCARFPEADPSRWRAWCLELEVVRGADRADHRETYIDRDLFHWEQALRRLVSGAFMTGTAHGTERSFELDGSEYLPYELPADALADAARLLLLARSLVADARFARTARLSLTEWSDFFLAMVRAYLGAASDPEQRALLVCLHEIYELRRLDVSGARFGYVIASELLREALEGLEGSRGHYLADGVVVSPLKEMRALPFRVIFVCGLGEGLFPAPTGPDALDLTSQNRAAGDVTPRERDKYLFLETITCARERLYLSYVARDLQTDDELNPAPILAELMRHLDASRDGKAAKRWVKEQPLRRFHESYFESGTSRGPSRAATANFSSQARAEWQARSWGRLLKEQSKGSSRSPGAELYRLEPGLVRWLGLCPLDRVTSHGAPARRLTLSLADLRRFLECPLQGWAAAMLRLAEDEEVAEAEREDEPFTTGRLRETSLLRAVFLEGLKRGIAWHDRSALEALYKLHAEAYTRRGWTPIGLFGDAERQRHVACLSSWYEHARTHNLVAHEFRVYRFGAAREAECVDRIEPAISLEVPLQGRPGESRAVRVDLVGRTEIVVPALPVSIIPVPRPEAAARDFLRGFLDAVVLSLLPGHHDPAQYHTHVFVVPRGGNPPNPVRTFHDVDAVRARQFLTDLIGDLLGSPHDYLLPCEAVFDLLDSERKKAIAASVEAMKENPRAACSSRYGPVPNFAQYEPPDEDRARAIIERRFGLFRDSGGLAQ
jgi:exodeoxyribonuclease V gamma subunit